MDGAPSLGSESLPRSPYIAISSREHSLYQARRRGSCGSDGTPPRVLNAIDALRRLYNSDLRAVNLSTGERTQVSNPPSDIIFATKGGAYNTPEDIRNPPPRRARARGVFIVGNGAPIKIDEGIEVRLRDGVDGQVDFII